ncbi:MAG TPA: hypothetical protein VN663_12170 [Ramlibacter sp.]|nr:hypothetical protein [Ramlibacter sp.]
MSDYIARLKSRGATSMDPAKKESYLRAVQEKVIPAIKSAEEKQRALTAEARTRPIKRVTPIGR